LYSEIRRQALLDYAENIVFTHNEIINAVDLDLGTGIFSEENFFANLQINGNKLAVFGDLALANSDDFTLLRLFLGGVGDIEPPAVMVSSSSLFTMIRSCKGLRFIAFILLLCLGYGIVLEKN
jgi:hypothetical protein